MIFSDRDFVSETLEDMRTAAEAMEEQGYKLHSYRFRTPVDNSPQAWDEDDPEPALEEFLQELGSPDDTYKDKDTYFNTNIRGRTFADLVAENSEADWENAVNEMLRQFRGLVNMGDPSADRPLHQEVDITYRLNTRGNYFDVVNLDGYEGEEFKEEVIEILQDEGFEAESRV